MVYYSIAEYHSGFDFEKLEMDGLDSLEVSALSPAFSIAAITNILSVVHKRRHSKMAP
jgi:hypothetical protein